MKMPKRTKNGFTLAEVLIVAAIIVVIAAIAIPVMNSSTKKAAVSTCSTNRATLVSAFNSSFALNLLLSDAQTSDGLALEIFTEHGLAKSGDYYYGMCPSGGGYRYSFDAEGGLVVVCSYHDENIAPGSEGGSGGGAATPPSVTTAPPVTTPVLSGATLWEGILQRARALGSAYETIDLLPGEVYYETAGDYYVLYWGSQPLRKMDADNNISLADYCVAHTTAMMEIDFSDMLTESDWNGSAWSRPPAKGDVCFAGGNYYISIATSSYDVVDVNPALSASLSWLILPR